MDERNTMHIKSEPYDIAILSYARHQLPLIVENISLGKHVIAVQSTSTQKMRMDERNTMHIESEPLRHRNSESSRHQLPLLVESISPWESML